MQVLVRDNNVEQALRVLKKKMQREGLFREMRTRSAYEKPSEKRAREKAETGIHAIDGYTLREHARHGRGSGGHVGPRRGIEHQRWRLGPDPAQLGEREACGS